MPIAARRLAWVTVAHVLPVDPHRPAVRLVEAEQQPAHRGLPGAGGADDGEGAPGRDLEAHVTEDRAPGVVPERDAVELDAPPVHDEAPGAGRIGDLLGLPEDRTSPRCR